MERNKTPEQRHLAKTWAQLLKRVFNIDVSVCPKCERHLSELGIAREIAAQINRAGYGRIIYN